MDGELEVHKQLIDLLTRQMAIQEEVKKNNEYQEKIEEILYKRAKPSEITTFKSYIKQAETMCCLSKLLQERLAKIDMDLTDSLDDEQGTILEHRKRKILDQLKEAKDIEKYIVERGKLVDEILKKYSDEKLDVDNFVDKKVNVTNKMKNIYEKIQIMQGKISAISTVPGNEEVF